MKLMWTYLAFLMFFKVPSCDTLKSVSVVLDQFGVLPCDISSCDLLQWIKLYPIDTTVAECRNQKCFFTKHFQERFGYISENNSLLLNSAKYIDQGIYRSICGSIRNDVKLEVIVPVHVSVDESANITLQCYADTQGDVNDVTWLYKGQKVLHYMKNGSSIPGRVYKGRVSLTEGGFKYGDLSLTITGVQKTDAGLYQCFVRDETAKGYPHAYMLHVNGGNQNPKIHSDVKGFTYSITAAFIVLSAVILILSVLLYRSKKALNRVTASCKEEIHSLP